MVGGVFLGNMARVGYITFDQT